MLTADARELQQGRPSTKHSRFTYYLCCRVSHGVLSSWTWIIGTRIDPSNTSNKVVVGTAPGRQLHGLPRGEQVPANLNGANEARCRSMAIVGYVSASHPTRLVCSVAQPLPPLARSVFFGSVVSRLHTNHALPTANNTSVH